MIQSIPPQSPTIAAATPVHKLGLGIALIVIAFLCSAIMSSFSKELTHIPPTLTLFWQYCISFVVFIPYALKPGLAGLKTQHFWLQLVRSLAGSVCQLLFFIAVKSLPLMDSVLLSNSAPLFIPFVIYFWFRKTVQPLVWFSLLIGLAGIILIIKPGPQMFSNPASLIALVSGIFSAFALVATNKLSDTEPPNRILIYNFGLSTVLLIPLCIWSWQPLTMRQAALLAGVGIFYALTQYFIIRAYHYATAAELSPFNYTVVVFSGLLGWWLFGNVPDRIAIFGTVLICAGGILSISAGHKEGRGHPFGSGHWRLRWRSLRFRYATKSP